VRFLFTYWPFYFRVIFSIKIKERIFMAGTGRIPLWLVALVGGLAVIAMLSLFLDGSYSGLGSSL
jgi:photosystem II PsbJ protein